MKMAIPMIVAILISLIQQTISDEFNIHEYVTPAMVNGETVDGSSYPWMVSLRSEFPGFVFEEDASTAYYKRFCGGALIRSDPIVILTAAHCVDGFQANDMGTIMDELDDQLVDINLYADLGRTKGPHLTNDYDESEDLYFTITISVLEMIYIHPLWNKDKIEEGYDLAVIIVNDGQSLPDNYSVATVPNQKTESQSCCEDGEELIALGYGRDNDKEEGGEPSDTLEQITMEYHPSNDCYEFLWTYFGNTLPVPPRYGISKDQVCVMGDNADICTGDSGGPLIRSTDDHETDEIVGIASYILGNDGDQCKSQEPHSLPSFFVSVAHFSDWINATIANPNLSPYIAPTNAPTQPNTAAAITYFVSFCFVLVYCTCFV